MTEIEYRIMIAALGGEPLYFSMRCRYNGNDDIVRYFIGTGGAIYIVNVDGCGLTSFKLNVISDLLTSRIPEIRQYATFSLEKIHVD